MNDEADLKYKQMVESSQQSLKILFDKVVNVSLLVNNMSKLLYQLE